MPHCQATIRSDADLTANPSTESQDNMTLVDTATIRKYCASIIVSAIVTLLLFLVMMRLILTDSYPLMDGYAARENRIELFLPAPERDQRPVTVSGDRLTIGVDELRELAVAIVRNQSDIPTG
jgi:hypothetical protein